MTMEPNLELQNIQNSFVSEGNLVGMQNNLFKSNPAANFHQNNVPFGRDPMPMSGNPTREK